MSGYMDPLVNTNKSSGYYPGSPGRQGAMDSAADPLSPTDFRLRAVRRPGGFDSSNPTSPSSSAAGSPTGGTRGSRSPFARAAKRSLAANGGSGSPRRRSPNGSPPPGRVSSARSQTPTAQDDGLLGALDDLTAEFGDFVDGHFVEILYGIAIAMVLVVLVTSLIARSYIPPYRGWDSERALYVSATWYSSIVLVALVLGPLLGPMAWNAYGEFMRFSSERTCKQKAALRAFRKGWKTGVVFYDRIGDRLRKMMGLPPMEQPLRSRLCV